jgi:hypothetical protein
MTEHDYRKNDPKSKQNFDIWPFSYKQYIYESILFYFYRSHYRVTRKPDEVENLDDYFQLGKPQFTTQKTLLKMIQYFDCLC